MRKAIRERLQQGVGTRAIARELGCSTTTVLAHRRRLEQRGDTAALTKPVAAAGIQPGMRVRYRGGRFIVVELLAGGRLLIRRDGVAEQPQAVEAVDIEAIP